MKRFMFTVLMAFMAINFAKADEFDTLYQRLFDDYLATTSLKSQSIIQGYIDSQQLDGSWPTIDYNGGTQVDWPALGHWDNLMFMAVAYNTPSHHFYHDATLKQKVKLGLLNWYNRNPQLKSAENWFFNDIGKQQRIYKVLILMKYAYTEPDLTNVIYNVCDRYLILPSDFYTSGYKGDLTNGVWIAGGLVNNGVIKKDLNTLKAGIKIMSDQLIVQPLGQLGTQSDFSFQVHGPTIYNGGYGVSLMKEISYYLYQSRGLTLIGFSQEHIDTLTDFLLKGDQWMVLGKTYDFNAIGREMTRPNKTTTYILQPILEQMISANPAKAPEFQAMLNNIKDETGSTESIIGNKHFYRGDYMTHRRKNLLIGIRMNSTRISSTEFINTENKKGNWMSLGSTSIMRTGSEYYNIYGVWDWAKIPGVTNPDVEITWTKDERNNRQSLPTAGGVSDGSNGVIGMSIDKVSKNGAVNVDVKAKKANFLWDSEMVCLGAGIQSNYAGAPVITTINQTYLTEYPVIDGTALSSFGEATYPNMGWVYHNQIGYVLRSNAIVKLKEDTQTGRWIDVNGGGSTSTQSSRIFKLWIDHGTKPTNATYDYAVLPNYTQQQTSDYATNPTSETISNTRDLQAVTQKVLRQTGAVFYTPGELIINANLKIAVDKPSTILVDWSTSTVKIAVADLNQDQTSLNVTVTFNNRTTEVLNYSLPQGSLKGSSVTKIVINPGPVTSVLDKPSERKTVIIFPNPVSDQVSVKGLNKGDVVKLLDLSGKLVKNRLQENTAGIALVSLQTLSAGTYIFLVESKGKTVYSNKIVKR